MAGFVPASPGTFFPNDLCAMIARALPDSMAAFTAETHEIPRLESCRVAQTLQDDSCRQGSEVYTRLERGYVTPLFTMTSERSLHKGKQP